MSSDIREIAVTAIVVTFDSAENITESLRALKREIESVGGEIIVVDNGSKDLTIKIIEGEFPEIKIIALKKNTGFAGANNTASEEARGEYLLFANPDMIPDEGCLEKMMLAFSRFDDCGAVAARMRNRDGSFQPTCRQLPTMKNIFFSRGSMFGQQSGRGEYTLGDFPETTAVPAAAATCLMIRKSLFEKIGRFDQRFFMYMEDTDLSVAIGDQGLKIYFAPDAGAVHYWGEGSSASRIKRSYYHHLSVWRYFLKHFPNGFSVFLLPAALFINFTIKALFGKKTAN